jgi:hypothetical protein
MPRCGKASWIVAIERPNAALPAFLRFQDLFDGVPLSILVSLPSFLDCFPKQSRKPAVEQKPMKHVLLRGPVVELLLLVNLFDYP